MHLPQILIPILPLLEFVGLLLGGLARERGCGEVLVAAFQSHDFDLARLVGVGGNTLSKLRQLFQKRLINLIPIELRDCSGQFERLSLSLDPVQHFRAFVLRQQPEQF